MREMRYLAGVADIVLDAAKCVGCGLCQTVCPHGVLAVTGGRAALVDRDGCMECGACATNCPAGALAVTPGVGCAAYILQVWLKGKARASCC